MKYLLNISSLFTSCTKHAQTHRSEVFSANSLVQYSNNAISYLFIVTGLLKYIIFHFLNGKDF